jgi:hypothetical protein
MSQKSRLPFFSSLELENPNNNNNNNQNQPFRPSLRQTESFYPKKFQTEAERLYYNSYFLPTKGNPSTVYKTESYYPNPNFSRSKSSIPVINPTNKETYKSNASSSLSSEPKESEASSSLSSEPKESEASSSLSSEPKESEASSSLSSEREASSSKKPILKKLNYLPEKKNRKEVSFGESNRVYDMNNSFYGKVLFNDKGVPVYSIFRNQYDQIVDKYGRPLIYNEQTNKYQKKKNGVPIKITSTQHIKNQHSQETKEIMKQKARNLINAKKSLFENFDNIYIPKVKIENNYIPDIKLYYKELLNLFRSEPEKMEIIHKNYLKQLNKIKNLKKIERERLLRLPSIFSNTDSKRELKKKYSLLKNLYKNNQELLAKINRNIRVPYSKQRMETQKYNTYKSKIIANSELGLMDNPFRSY